jgi:hypothetical protein|tara:strand:+ start:4039 stop:4302 length:264 start_codon:yes stop_codon:yes gene_type:complete
MIEDIVFTAHRSIEGGSYPPNDRSLYTGTITGPQIWNHRLGIHFIPVRAEHQPHWKQQKDFVGNVPITAVVDHNKKVLESFGEIISQ